MLKAPASYKDASRNSQVAYHGFNKTQQGYVLESQGPPSVDDSRTVVRLQRRRGADSEPGVAEPEEFETVHGSKPGSRFLRLTRQGERKRARGHPARCAGRGSGIV